MPTAPRLSFDIHSVSCNLNHGDNKSSLEQVEVARGERLLAQEIVGGTRRFWFGKIYQTGLAPKTASKPLIYSTFSQIGSIFSHLLRNGYNLPLANC